MTSIGTGYDLSASTYSPDGRIFQVKSLKLVQQYGILNLIIPGRIRQQGGRELRVSKLSFSTLIVANGLLR